MAKREYPKLCLCQGCSRVYNAYRGREVGLCVNCRIKRSITAARQMQEKRGIFYNRWKVRYNEWRIEYARRVLNQEEGGRQ